MKTQTAKKFFTFIIVMMFSVSFLNAQRCKGNKVLLYSWSGRCTSTCVNPSEVKKYLLHGWSYYPCSGGTIGQNKISPAKPLIKIHTESAMISKKRSGARLPNYIN